MRPRPSFKNVEMFMVKDTFISASLPFLNTMHCGVLVLEGALCLHTTFDGSGSGSGPGLDQDQSRLSQYHTIICANLDALSS